MKIRYYILYSILLSICSTLYGQINNPKAFLGTWEGTWINSTFGSTGDVSVVITTDAEFSKFISEWEVTGNVLGTPGIGPFTADGIFADSKIVVDFVHPTWGNIKGELLYEGTFTGMATDSPVGVDSIFCDGEFNSYVCTGFFEMNFFNTDVQGFMIITKVDPILIPELFTAETQENGTILLEWFHEGGNTTGYRIERALNARSEFVNIAEIPAGESSYHDTDILSSTDYVYRIVAFNENFESDYSEEASATSGVVSVDNQAGIPLRYALKQNYPNPFNPSTNILINLPERSEVNISVFNSLGQLVSVIENSYLNPGSHNFVFNAKNLPSGVYIINMKAVSKTINKTFNFSIKSLLMK